MTTPDQTAAFEADASRITEADKLKARLAELENTTTATPPAPEKAAENNEAAEAVDAVEDYKTVEVEGFTFRYHVPKSSALLAFSLGASNAKDGELSMSTLRMFLRFHLLEEDFETFIEEMINPESPITEDSMGDIISAMVEDSQDSAEFNAPKTGPR